MDPITHGLLGACTSQAIYRRRYPTHRLWIFGLLAAMAPDLDIFIRRAHDPLFAIYFHRHFTHSLMFIPIGASVIALLTLLLWPRYRTIAFATWLTCLVAYASHGLLDCLTSYGTMWYWPFSEIRVSWDIISIIDLRFTAILFLGVIASNVFVSSFVARITLMILSIFLGFAAIQHQRASHTLTQFASKQWDIEGYRAMPGLASLTNYSGVIRSTNNKLQIFSIQLAGLNHAQITPGPDFDLFTQNDLPKSILQNPSLLKDFAIFNWFSDGYITAYQTNPLLLVDLRYLLEFKPPYRALWGIEFPKDHNAQHIIWLHNQGMR